MIGKKASRENLFEIASCNRRRPSPISTRPGRSTPTTARAITGLIVKETPTEITLRDANGKDYPIAVKGIEKKTKTTTSLMPEDGAKALTEQELVDLVEYLFSLKGP